MERSEIAYWYRKLQEKSQSLPLTLKQHSVHAMEFFDKPYHTDFASELKEIELEMQQNLNQISEIGAIQTMLLDGLQKFTSKQMDPAQGNRVH